MDVHDRGMLYYRLLKHDIQEARRVVCGEHKMVASKNTIIPRVSALSLSLTSSELLCNLISCASSRVYHFFY